jgi:hypothetical protein
MPTKTKAPFRPMVSPVIVQQNRVESFERLERLDISLPPYSTSPLKPSWLREAYKNGELWVQVQYHETPFGRVKQLYIGRQDKRPIRDWYTLQWVKNQVCGSNAEAVEIFPPQSRLVDDANIYHLWVLPDGYSLPFGMRRDEAKNPLPMEAKES